MKRKFKLVIEYELDDPDATLDSEREAWLAGEVDVLDIIAAQEENTAVSFAIVEE